MADEKQGTPLQKLVAMVNAGGDLDELDDTTITALFEQLKSVRSRRRRRATVPQMPARLLALQAIEVLAVPSTPQVIASVVQARTGQLFDARLLATVRRDERRGWDREAASGATRAQRLAPALHYELATPVRAAITNSSWGLARRLVTLHSPRADHPASVLALLDESLRIGEVDAEVAERVSLLACQLAAGIPGAPEPGLHRLDAVRRAATEERERFGELAETERALAVEKLGPLLTPDTAAWGVEAPLPLPNVQNDDSA